MARAAPALAILAQRLLLGDDRARIHGRNLVLEASGAAVGDRIYIASGAGHVYGLRAVGPGSVQWDYYTGSDIDGTAVPTDDGKLLVAVEKQYIPGRGGVLCLDPSRPPAKAAEWFFPTGDRKVGEWAGGVIGSAAVNDAYNGRRQVPGRLRVQRHRRLPVVWSRDRNGAGTVNGPAGARLKTPVTIGRVWNSGSHLDPAPARGHAGGGGYDQRVHLYGLHASTPAAQGDDGALPSANGDGTFWKVCFTVRAQFFAAGASSRHRRCGTAACTSAAGTAGFTAWGTLVAHHELLMAAVRPSTVSSCMGKTSRTLRMVALRRRGPSRPRARG